MIKSISKYGFIFLAAISLNAFAQQTPNQTPQQPNAQSTAALSTLSTIDKNEIAAGKLAMKKANTPAVKDFAKKMVTEHQANLTQTQKLAKAQKVPLKNTPEVTQLKKQGTADLQLLKNKKGADFDKAYMDAMVKGHQDADAMLSSKENDPNPAVTNQLKDTRTHVQAHLDEAKNIQSKL